MQRLSITLFLALWVAVLTFATQHATAQVSGVDEVVPAPDLDADGVDDAIDNCSAVANPRQCLGDPTFVDEATCTDAGFTWGQRDSDNDGVGNACDADLTNNCVVNFHDFGVMKTALGSADPHADLDDVANGVDSADVDAMRGMFYREPGPSNAEVPACFCDDPLFEEIPIRWTETPRSGEAIPGSWQRTWACDQGTVMEVRTQALAPDHAYTQWFGFFDHPENCLLGGNTPGRDCGVMDMFNLSADANFRYADGGVATGFDDEFRGFVAAGAPFEGEVTCPTYDQTGCLGQKTARAAKDDTRGELNRPRDAEYHAVLIDHGPYNPETFPKQTTHHDGGCNTDVEPDGQGGHADAYLCRVPQASGVNTEGPLECIFDPICYAKWLASVGAPFVVGFASGPVALDLDGDRISLDIKGKAPFGSSTAAEGSTFDLIRRDSSDAVENQWKGDVECISVNGASAKIIGTITTPAGLPDPSILLTIDDDPSSGGAIGDMIGYTLGGHPLPCPAQVVGVATVQATVDEGNYHLSD